MLCAVSIYVPYLQVIWHAISYAYLQASLAKWLSVRLRTKLFWVRVQLQWLCHTVLKKKTKKTSLRISSKCWCVPIMVMLWNELGDGTAVDMGWFRMLRRDSNTIYGKNIDCVCGEMWRMWYWYVTEKKMKPGGRTRCDEAVNIRGQS